jgi:hypothetical protein
MKKFSKVGGVLFGKNLRTRCSLPSDYPEAAVGVAAPSIITLSAAVAAVAP